MQKNWCSGKTNCFWTGDQYVGLKGNSGHMGDPCFEIYWIITTPHLCESSETCVYGGGEEQQR